jgi:hypothetical protein
MSAILVRRQSALASIGQEQCCLFDAANDQVAFGAEDAASAIG